MQTGRFADASDTLDGGAAKGFIRELDGLRGIAILLVMVHRLWPREGAGGLAALSEVGWIGVDLFFVISGFLIAGILLDTRNDPDYFRNFYARRVLRIFPLYYLFIGVMLVVFPLSEHVPYFQTDYIDHSGSPLWYVLFLGNIPEGLLGHDTPYWLAPVWSLAIEEQFYLTFPWLVRALEWRKLTGVLIALLLVAPVVRLVTMLILPDQERVQYMFTLARLDTLAAGCLLAILVRSRLATSSGIDRILRVTVGVAIVVALVTGLDRTTAFGRTLGYSVVAFGFAAVVLAVVRGRDQRWTAALRNPALCYFGKLCFGLYLLHRPAHTLTLAAASRLGLDPASPWLVPVAIVLALAFASASWFAFERPILRLKRRFQSARHPAGATVRILPAAVVMLLAIAACHQRASVDHDVVPDASGDASNDVPGECPCIVDARLLDAELGDSTTGDAPADALPTSSNGALLYPENRTQSPINPSVVAQLQAISGGSSCTSQVFAKIGDSITASPSFFSCFDTTGVDLDTHGNLATTLDFFQHGQAAGSSPFSRSSLAAVGGSTTADLLAGSPSPLDQEITTINACYAVVMLGTNDVRYGRSVDAFGADLWTIIDRLRARGVIPILSTIPSIQGDPGTNARIPVFNRVIRAIAQGRSIPLVDLAREMAPLPGEGISGDGLHPTAAPQGACVLTQAALQYGYNTRNLISLDALDRTRAAVNGTASDSGGAVRTGTGHFADPFGGTLPLVDLGDTRTGDQLIGQYTGCSSQAQSGHEIVYRLDLAAATTIDAYVIDRDSVNVDVHILAGSATAPACVSEGDGIASATVGPGPTFIVVDAPAAAQDGEYLLVVQPR